MKIKELDRQHILTLLTSNRLGRLACSKDGQPYVIPFTFSFSGSYLYSFSMLGQKIEWMRLNPNVCVQVDEFANDRAWKSVVINGVYEELPDRIGFKVERERAWALLSRHANWWEPGGLKPENPQMATITPHLFYRIKIDSMTGRQAFDE